MRKYINIGIPRVHSATSGKDKNPIERKQTNGRRASSRAMESK